MHFSGFKGTVITIMARPKKRKFAGNRYTGPLKKTTKSCASEEKVKYTKKKSVGPELDGYRLFDVKNLLNFVSVCSLAPAVVAVVILLQRRLLG